MRRSRPYPVRTTLTCLVAASGLAGVGLAAPAAAYPPVAGTAHAGHDAQVTHHKASPFTLAEVSRTGDVLRVRWSAHGVKSVKVFTGTGPAHAHRLVGVGGGHGELAMTPPSGTVGLTWFRLVPDRGPALSITVRSAGLETDRNLRDFGGYRTRDGNWVRMGAIYRSEALSLNDADTAFVSTLGLRAIYDLRTPGEAAPEPDFVPSGAAYHAINVYGTDDLEGDLPADGPAAADSMRQIYRDMVTGKVEQQAFKQLFTSIARTPDSQLVHCTSGKDRTGWAMATLLMLLKVPDQTIMTDYLLSNRYVYDSPEVQGMLAGLPPEIRPVIDRFVVVDASYLRAAIDQMRRSYGSVEHYLTRGVGLSPATVETLRDRLLVTGKHSR